MRNIIIFFVGNFLALLLCGCPGRAFNGGLEEVEGGYYYFFDHRMIAPNPRNEESLRIPRTVIDYDGGKGFVVAERKNSTNSPDVPDYWIIDTKKSHLIGPLSLEEYLLKRSELSVPNSVRLEVESKI